MSRWIDVDALIELIPKTSQSKFENCWTCKLLSAESVKEIINSAPTIEMVKCEECKYKLQCRKVVEHIIHEPTSVSITYRPIDSCSYGERREP